MKRARMIQCSFRCLNFGWLSLVPAAGIAFGILAICAFVITLHQTEDDWNPAKWHLYSGAALALASLLLHGLAAMALIHALLT